MESGDLAVEKTSNMESGQLLFHPNFD